MMMDGQNCIQSSSKKPEKLVIYEKLTSIGCCSLCCLRFLGETQPSSYKDLKGSLSRIGVKDAEDVQPNKLQKRNPCIACLGLLQHPNCDVIVEKVLSEIIAADYDCETFNVAITLPVMSQVRAHSMWIFMEKHFEDFARSTFHFDVVTIGVKDVWKWLYPPLIGEKLKKEFCPNSEFFVSITIDHEANCDECNCLLKMCPQIFKKKNRHQQQEQFSRKGVEQAFKEIKSIDFLKHYGSPPADVSLPVFCDKVSLQHNSIFLAGRYNKYSRELPQTPWLIGGERKLESSVQELISKPIEEATMSESSKFAASGREDVDVRALGRGRPFTVELINPRRVKIDRPKARELQQLINKDGKGKVAVSHLQLTDKDCLTSLKSGEENKKKEYTALCVSKGSIPGKLSLLNDMGPVTLRQKTPIRVLHRRPVATRERVVHWMKAEPVSHSLSEEGYSYFTLRLSTQAGTYIKEFVHGDFNRTTPNLCQILGTEVDIVALDVQEIVLEWPPEVDDIGAGT